MIGASCAKGGTRVVEGIAKSSRDSLAICCVQAYLLGMVPSSSQYLVTARDWKRFVMSSADGEVAEGGSRARWVRQPSCVGTPGPTSIFCGQRRLCKPSP